MKWYRLISILSLDVVAGAVISSWFFSVVFSVEQTYFAYLALALTVWIIYTADHLLDARNISHHASTPRHQFHQRHSKHLTRIILGLMLLDFVTLFFLPVQLVYTGIFLATLVIIFLAVQSSIPWTKELFIAIIYTSGILLPLNLLDNTTFKAAHCILVFQFLIVALINLLIFSWLDSHSDQQDGLNSIVVRAGKGLTSLVIFVLITLQFLLAVSQVLIGELAGASLIILLMTIVLLVIFLKREEAELNDAYRFVGDAVFFLPVIYML